ncbi:MAG: hypothetical protein LBB76_07380 [Azoarcus sp.]|jgi:hypothetical protein|nr:hypothetical protein [Azoarcus sp.]
MTTSATAQPAASYQTLAAHTAELKKLAEDGQWEDAAHAMSSIAASVKSLHPARAEDRAAIERALADLTAVAERAGPLHADIARLLAAFGPE